MTTARDRVASAARGPWWFGFAALFPIAVVLLAAAVWAEVGQALFGLAGLTCAACADPSNGIDTVGAAGGLFGAGAAAGGAAAGGGTTGTGETGGVGVGRDDRTIIPPGAGNLAGDAARQDWTRGQFGPGPGPIERTIRDTTFRVQEQVEEWTREWVDPDRRSWFQEKGTAPASKA